MQANTHLAKNSIRSLIEKLLGKKKHISLEIVSTKETGIRSLIQVGHAEADVVKKHLLSFLLGARITVVDDYLPITIKTLAQQHRRTVTLIRFKSKRILRSMIQCPISPDK